MSPGKHGPVKPLTNGNDTFHSKLPCNQTQTVMMPDLDIYRVPGPPSRLTRQISSSLPSHQACCITPDLWQLTVLMAVQRTGFQWWGQPIRRLHPCEECTLFKKYWTRMWKYWTRMWKYWYPDVSVLVLPGESDFSPEMLRPSTEDRRKKTRAIGCIRRYPFILCQLIENVFYNSYCKVPAKTVSACGHCPCVRQYVGLGGLGSFLVTQR